jgi:hypothetical protein
MMSFDDNNFTTDNKTIAFDRKIMKVMILEDIVIILLKDNSSPEQELQSNVLTYSKNGDKLWDAQLPPERYPPAYFPKSRLEPYCSLGLDSEGNVYASNMDSFCFLDKQTGAITEMHVNK